MNPTWVETSAEEVTEVIEKNATRGVSPSNTGRILRDQYGIPSVKLLTGKKFGKILAEKNVAQELPEDLTSLLKRTTLLKAHLATHKHDNRSKRGLQLMEAKILRLTKYYKASGRIPATWQYGSEKSRIAQ